MKSDLARRAAAPLAGLFALCLALASAGCPETFAQLCPPGTRSEGTFAATLTPLTGAASDCQVFDTDGGLSDASLSGLPAPFTTGICSSLASDGGPQVYLALATSVRVSPMGDGGSFGFGSSTTVEGTRCGCTILVQETIDGTLNPASPDASVVYDPDAGGFSALSGFGASVVDHVDGGADAGCLCNVPCNLRYTLSATKQ